MDFSFSEEQQSISDLAGQIFRDAASQERMRELERGSGPRFDRDLWAQAAEAGLVGIAVPELQGGAGLGFVEVAAMLEQLGRTVAPIPLLETVVMGAMPIVEFGSAELQEALLPAVVAGELVLTAALSEQGDDLTTLGPPATEARADGAGWRLHGTKICVPGGAVADRILVPATTGDAVDVFVVDSTAPGVSVVPTETTAGQPEAHLELDGVAVSSADRLGAAGQGEQIAEWISLRATAALAALALGVCEEALDLTSAYIKERKQFGQPIAMFQAVGHRAADAYVDTEAIRLTTWQAAWRIGAGLPAEAAVAVAKFWASQGGKRVTHAAQHLHGGVGVDRDYALHRYFLYARQIELTFGGGTPQLLRVGRMLADASFSA